jgi:hypothetical protein
MQAVCPLTRILLTHLNVLYVLLVVSIVDGIIPFSFCPLEH